MKSLIYKTFCFFASIFIFNTSFCQKDISKISENERIAYLIKGEQVRNSTKLLINDSIYDFDCINLLLKSKEKLSFELITDSVQKQVLSKNCKKIKTLIKISSIKKYEADFNTIIRLCKPHIFSCNDDTEPRAMEDLLEKLSKLPVNAS